MATRKQASLTPEEFNLMMKESLGIGWQKQLAKATGTSVGMISRYATGSAMLPMYMETIATLVKALRECRAPLPEGFNIE